MSTPAEFSQWLHTTAWATALRESEVVFPLLLVAHVLGLVGLVGSIFIVDLRLLGWRFRSVPALPFVRSLLRVTWVGFWVLAVSGVPLLAAQAGKLYGNPYLRAKLVLLVVVGVNAFVFHRVVSARIESWSEPAATPRPAKVVATVSLLSWTLLVFVSRFIPLADAS